MESGCEEELQTCSMDESRQSVLCMRLLSHEYPDRVGIPYHADEIITGCDRSGNSMLEQDSSSLIMVKVRCHSPYSVDDGLELVA